MDYLLARIKTRSQENLRMALSDVTVYTDINVVRRLPYNDEYKLQNREWFCIEKFSEQNYCPEWMKKSFNNLNYHAITEAEYASTLYLVSIQDDSQSYHFQRILSNGRMLDKRKALCMSEQLKLVEYENLLTINPEPDATYDKVADRLLFKDLGRIKPFFSGIDILYREATDAEVANFLQLDVIELTNGFGQDSVSIPNRRRINNAITQYNSFNNEQKERLKTYVEEYCPDILNPTTNKFSLGSDDNLRTFIYAIDQRYYSTPINSEKRIATSVEKI